MLLQSQPRAAAKVAPAIRPEPQGATETFVFLLLDGFDALALAGATEPLRQANALSGRPLYGWRVVSMTGTPVVAAGGLAVLADARLSGLARGESLFVIGAPGEDEAARAHLMAALRREAAHGVRIGAIGTGIQTLARAGRSRARRCRRSRATACATPASCASSRRWRRTSKRRFRRRRSPTSPACRRARPSVCSPAT
jgi:hypothetical protein